MKTLRTSLEGIITPNRLSGVVEISPTEIIDDILKAIAEYVKTIEEVECMLLELLPDSEFSVKRKVSDTCTLIYSIKKE